MITFVSSNQNKIDDVKFVLDNLVKYIKLDVDEIQSLDRELVIKSKLQKARDMLYSSCLVDDMSLNLEEWNGFPGTFIKFARDTIGNEKLHTLLKNRNATWYCSFGLWDSEIGFKYFENKIDGIITEPRGKSWGFENIFQPNNHNFTFGEMTANERMQLNPRFTVLNEVKAVLEDLNKRFPR